MTLPLNLHASGTTLLPPDEAGAVGNETKTASGGVTNGPLVTPTVPVLSHVIGLDASLTATGIACSHGVRLVCSAGKKTDTLDDRQTRLASLVGRILFDVTGDRCHADLPRIVVIEQPSYGSQGGSQHDRSGLWWLLVDQMLRRGIRVVEVAPSTLKKYATGKGNAGKDQVLAAAVRRLPIAGIDNNNAADAGWLCAVGHDLLGQPLTDLPQAHRAALDVLRARLHIGEPA